MDKSHVPFDPEPLEIVDKKCSMVPVQRDLEVTSARKWSSFFKKSQPPLYVYSDTPDRLIVKLWTIEKSRESNQIDTAATSASALKGTPISDEAPASPLKDSFNFAKSSVKPVVSPKRC